MTEKRVPEQEEENTVDTPAPIPVDPALVLPPVETDEVAIAVEVPVIHDIPLQSDHHGHDQATAVPHASTITITNENTAACETCMLIAPATLAEGYTFPANVDGIDFIVTVPPGGVTEGQTFQVPYPSRSNNNSTVQQQPPSSSVNTAATATSVNTPTPPTSTNNNNTHNIPTEFTPLMGRWRNGLCDSCDVCRAMFWMGFYCSPILVAQVMQRHKLDYCGSPSPSHHYTFWTVSATWIFIVVLCFSLARYIVYVIPLFMAIFVMNTRYHMRQRYQIPVQEKNCDQCEGRMEDFCCAFWCNCCVAIQMARQSHDEHEHPYYCCSETGLHPGAPEIV